MKRFKLESEVNLPEYITHCFEEYSLHLVREVPTWIVTDSDELKILKLLKNHTIREAIKEATKSLTNGSLDRALQVTTNLLQKIERAGFYADSNSIVPLEEIHLHVYLTNTCNLYCKHCFRNAKNTETNCLSTNQWKRIIDEFANINITRVSLSGGEPMVRKDFFTISRYIHKKGFKQGLLTNGTLIRSKETAQQLAMLFDEIQISLDGASREVTDFYRGKGVFKKVLESLNYFEGLPVDLNVAIMITPLTAKTFLSDFDNLNKSIRAKVSYRLGALANIGRGEFVCPEQESDDSLVTLIDELRKKGIAVKDPYAESFLKRDNCGYGGVLTIDHDGKVYACPLALKEDCISDTKQTSLKESIELLKTSKQKTNVGNIGICSQCDLKYICAGGCRIRNRLKNGNVLNPICDDGKKEDIYKRLIKAGTSLDLYDVLIK